VGVSFVTGKLGAGKGKYAVMKLLEAAFEGRRIAGNVDLNLGEFSKRKHRRVYVRLPDKPTARDLEALGHGNPESYDEDRNGLLVLDELGTWFNSRSFQDKDRAPVLDWMIHARKHGWDVLLICQNEVQIDKQAREALGEVFVRCMAMHKLRIPVVGWLLGRWGRLPRFHLASIRVGSGSGQFVSERTAFRGDHLHPMYDTRQIFRADPEQCTFSQLHPLYFSGPARLTWAQRIKRFLGGMRSVPPRIATAPAPRPVVQLLRALPPDVRVVEFRRLQRLGYV